MVDLLRVELRTGRLKIACYVPTSSYRSKNLVAITRSIDRWPIPKPPVMGFPRTDVRRRYRKLGSASGNRVLQDGL